MRTTMSVALFSVFAGSLACGPSPYAADTATPTQPAVAQAPAGAPAPSEETTNWVQGLTRVSLDAQIPVHADNLTIAEIWNNRETWTGKLVMMQVRSEDFANQLGQEQEAIYYMHLLPTTAQKTNHGAIAFRFTDQSWIGRRRDRTVDLPCIPGNCPQTTLVARMTDEVLSKIIDDSGRPIEIVIFDVLGAADRIDTWETEAFTTEFPPS